MSTASINRQYDVIVWGASGYTGALTAEHIARAYPTNIRWAVAGRSAGKLQAVVDKCKRINPDTNPSIEICNLDEAELGDLARKTTIILATVGPYASYGEPCVKACAENGTHYMDVTGELPWVLKMTRKYESVAKSTGAIMISQLGLESVPSDLLAYSLVTFIRKNLGVPTREVIMAVHELKTQLSGGTLASALGMMEHFTIKEFADARIPFSHSPIPGPKAASSQPWYTSILGIRHHPLLGSLTTFIGAVSDVPIVERSWGLLGGAQFYGPNFRYSEYLRAKTPFHGLLIHFGFLFGQIFLLFGFIRALVRKRVLQPGQGADESVYSKDIVEYRAVGYPEKNTTQKAFSKASFYGGIYKMTGIMLAEAALTLLKDESPAKKLGGGFLTPATLGEPFIERLHEHGFKIETTMLQ